MPPFVYIGQFVDPSFNGCKQVLFPTQKFLVFLLLNDRHPSFKSSGIIIGVGCGLLYKFESCLVHAAGALALWNSLDP
jgi:hypothetical protein